MSESSMPSSEAERWLPVPRYEGLYEVSDLGRVRSLDRVVTRSDGRRCRYPGVMLRPAATGKITPHQRVALSANGKACTELVHQLVLEAFVGPRPEGQQSRHGPGGSLDNRLVNLCYGTPVENMADMERDGTAHRGETHGGAKLTEVIVLECRRRHAAGESQRSLAAEFGVGNACMSFAIRGITWGRLPGAVPGRQNPFTHHNAKLTPGTVEEARQRYAAGESRVALAAEYGVARATLWQAIQNRWS